MRLADDIRAIITAGNFDAATSARHLRRLEEDHLTRDKNPESHFCAYFIPFDADTRQVFLGHHKKSGLWLFNGGHIDANETTREAVKREMSEEWGREFPFEPKPFLITVTEIVSNPAGRPCRWHFDVHYKVPMDSTTAEFDMQKLATEFYENHWLSIADARKRVTDPATLLALDALAV